MKRRGAQGLLAGLNASRQARDLTAWEPRRDEAYLGVLVDDLVTLGTQEPYRMFTSRAEYRLLLREDNADLRLTPAGRELDLITNDQWQTFQERRESIGREVERLETTYIQPDSPAATLLRGKIASPLSREYSLADLLRRPGLGYDDVAGLAGGVVTIPEHAAEQVSTQIKYAGYIDRQAEEIERLRRQESLPIPENLDYTSVHGLSNEIQQKLSAAKPTTLARAGRISGVTPAALSLLLVHLKRRDGMKKASNA